MGPDENSTALSAGVLYVKTEDHGYVLVPSKIVNLTFEECIDHMIKDDEEAYKSAMTIRNPDSFTFTFHIRKNILE